jgi:hypothetical protein
MERFWKTFQRGGDPSTEAFPGNLTVLSVTSDVYYVQESFFREEESSGFPENWATLFPHPQIFFGFF